MFSIELVLKVLMNLYGCEVECARDHESYVGR